MTATLAPRPAPAPAPHTLALTQSRRWPLVLTTAIAPMAWGTGYLVTTEALPPGRPLLGALLRALPAGLALAALTRRRPIGRWWAKAAVLGVLNIGAFFALLFLATYRLPGGVAATMGAIQPLVAATLAALLLGERLRRATVLAGMLGLVGVALLVVRAGTQLDTAGLVAGLGGATSMATGVVLTKHWGRPVPLGAFTSWQLIAGGLFLVPLTLLIEGPPPALTATNVAGFAWLGLIGTAVAYVLWFRGIQRLPVASVSLLGLLSPVVATTIGWIVVGQSLSVGQLLGMALVLGAVACGQRPSPELRGASLLPATDRRRRQRTTRPPEAARYSRTIKGGRTPLQPPRTGALSLHRRSEPRSPSGSPCPSQRASDDVSWQNDRSDGRAAI